MPELPEVETIKRQLNKKIKDKKIKSVRINLAKFLKTNKKTFKKAVEGTKIKGVKRRAKLLIIELDNDYALVVHLKMTGQLIYPDGEITKHTHLIYTFSDNSQLLHNDMRQFGWVKLLKKEDLKKYLEEKEAYGPEPLAKDFTLKLFKDLLKKKSQAQIKPLLMNQQFVAGIGNVYSDEILFYVQVKPTRKVKDLTQKEIEKIFKGIKEILPQAISKRGTSSDNYVDTNGKEGRFVPFLKVYQRAGQSCLRCGAEIERQKIGGRSAHFCPKCQK